MNQNPQPKKKPAAPPQPQWNPYYRRNPDGTPGSRDRTLQENAARADAEAQKRRERQSAARDAARPAPTREGLGEPVRRPAAPRVHPAGQSEPMQHRRPQQPKPERGPGGTRYRHNDNGTLSRVYPRNTSRAAARSHHTHNHCKHHKE